MNIVTSLMLILLIILLLVVLYIVNYRIHQDGMITLFQFNKDFTNYNNSDEISKPFSEFNFNVSKTFHNANFIFFSDYIFIDEYLPKVNFIPSTSYIIYGFVGTDLLANKSYFAKHMQTTSDGIKCIPKTYILNNDNSSLSFSKDIYILKANRQRQEGILITKDIKYIKDKAYDDGYVVAQQLVQDVFLVNKRKINMRIYLLIVIKNNTITWYVYKDGFMYYTPKLFISNSDDKDVNVTSGYVPREIYDENPLTHSDFYNFIGINNSNKLQKNIYSVFNTVKDIYSDELLELNKNIPGVKVNIIGCDIQPTANLDVLLIECNKGCSLVYMDERDKEVKLNLVKNMFSLIGVTNGDKTMFHKI